MKSFRIRLQLVESIRNFELICFADDLQSLIKALDLFPCFVGGVSWGAMVSLQYISRYPEQVIGLIPWWLPSAKDDFWKNIVAENFHIPADTALSGGMQAVISETDFLLNRGIRNDSGREQLISLNPKIFASVMKKWGDWYLSGNAHFGGLTDMELRKISVPTLIIPGKLQREADDEQAAHPFSTANRLCDLIPKAKMELEYDFVNETEMESFLDRWGKEDPKKRSLNHERAELSLHFAKYYPERVAGFINRVEKESW